MPQLLLLALAGAGIVAGYHWVKRQIEAEQTLARQEREVAGAKTGAMRDLGPLAWDEATGSYRPAMRRD